MCIRDSTSPVLVTTAGAPPSPTTILQMEQMGFGIRPVSYTHLDVYKRQDYAHVLVDEAQDLSPMQWRMLARRGRSASWTVVGDAAQASWGCLLYTSRCV